MTFRNKLMLTMAPLVVALASVGVVSGMVTGILARQPAHIWRDNYRSVLAAQRMKESVERVHESVLQELLDRADAVRSVATSMEVFERELAVEADNVTEPGEGEAVAKMRLQWTEFKRVLAEFRATADLAARREFAFGTLHPAFRKVKQTAEEILDINQDAMILKGQRTEQRAARFERILTVAVILASVLGLLASGSLTTRLLRPLSVHCDCEP